MAIAFYNLIIHAFNAILFEIAKDTVEKKKMKLKRRRSVGIVLFIILFVLSLFIHILVCHSYLSVQDSHSLKAKNKQTNTMIPCVCTRHFRQKEKHAIEISRSKFRCPVTDAILRKFKTEKNVIKFTSIRAASKGNCFCYK